MAPGAARVVDLSAQLALDELDPVPGLRFPVGRRGGELLLGLSAAMEPAERSMVPSVACYWPSLLERLAGPQNCQPG